MSQGIIDQIRSVFSPKLRSKKRLQDMRARHLANLQKLREMEQEETVKRHLQQLFGPSPSSLKEEQKPMQIELLVLKSKRGGCTEG